MSMINDALRRASSAAKAGPEATTAPPPMPVPPPPPPSATAPLLPPVAFPPPGGAGNLPPLPPMRVGPARKKSVLPLLLVLTVLFCGAGAGGYYFWKKGVLSIAAREKINAAGEEPTDNDTIAALFGDEQARAKISAAMDRAEAQAPAQVPDSREATPVAAAPVLAAPPQPSRPVERPAVKPVPAAVAPQTPVKFPPLRLQSIFYRPSDPSVMINAKTLFVGDEVHGVIVADITPSSVTLVLSGQTNVLTLR